MLSTQMSSNPVGGGYDQDEDEDVCDDQIPDANPAAAESPNRSSSFLFDSMYDSPLLGALRPNQVPDQPGEEQSSSQEVAMDRPLPLIQQRRRSELLTNQEAEEQEAVQWGESFLNLSEWGDSLLVGEHFLDRQSLLRHMKRTESEQELQQLSKDCDIGDGPLVVSQLGHCRVQPLLSATVQNERDKEKADNRQARTAKALSGNDFEPSGRHEMIREKGDTATQVEKETEECVFSNNDVLTHPHAHKGSESSLYCSPGLQEIFDRWPSMSDQPGSENPQTQADASDAPDVPELKLAQQSGAAKKDFHQGRVSRTENTPERPGSAGDLIPPTQETPPVTPRVKLTTSVQSPITAQPFQLSTSSNAFQDKTAAKKYQTGNYNRLSDAACASISKREANRVTIKELKAATHVSLKPSQNLHRPAEHTSPPHPSPQPEPPSDTESPQSLEGFTLQLSQDASLCCSNSGTFSIVDVASDRRLFDTFIKEWKTKERFAVALACEKREHKQQSEGGIGGKHKRGNQNINTDVTILYLNLCQAFIPLPEQYFMCRCLFFVQH